MCSQAQTTFLETNLRSVSSIQIQVRYAIRKKRLLTAYKSIGIGDTGIFGVETGHIVKVDSDTDLDTDTRCRIVFCNFLVFLKKF